jgi:hypothetical protein
MVAPGFADGLTVEDADFAEPFPEDDWVRRTCRCRDSEAAGVAADQRVWDL